MNRRITPRSTFALLGVGLLLAVMLAACGSSTSATTASAASTSSNSGVSTAPPATSTSAASTGTPAASPMASPAAGSGSATVLVANNPTLGAILTTSDGMTLYTYAKDAPGTSNCSDKCATNWPPLLSDTAPAAPDGATGTFGLTTRDDGSSQVTYNDMPLYTYIKDTAPGDVNGQDVGDVWYAAQASPNGTPTADSDSESDATTLAVANDAKLGNILTDAKGMTLYIYTKDTPGTSNCSDQCAVNWPPLIVTDSPTAPDSVTGKLGTTTRTDGKLQVTYNDQPLYYFAGDTKAGDTTGQGVGDVWYVVNP